MRNVKIVAVIKAVVASLCIGVASRWVFGHIAGDYGPAQVLGIIGTVVLSLVPYGVLAIRFVRKDMTWPN